MSRSPAGPVSAVPSFPSEMAISPASDTSNGQFPFTATEISDLGVDASALDSAYAFHMSSPERLQLRPGCETDSLKESIKRFCQLPWNFSFSDLPAELANVEGERQLSVYNYMKFQLEPFDVAFQTS